LLPDATVPVSLLQWIGRSVQRCGIATTWPHNRIGGKEVEAWRLRDERWLVWRAVIPEADDRSRRGFFSFSESMPQ
jgi:hypothetical protein